MSTPADGIEDLHFSLGAKRWGTKLLAVYHDFDADNGATDYGKEIDLLAAKTFQKRYTVALKYANYDADAFAADTEKIRLFARLKF